MLLTTTYLELCLVWVVLHTVIKFIIQNLDIEFEYSHIESGKGGVGNAVQAAFGLGLDNRPEADFPDASGPGVESPGVELKIVPLEMKSNKWRVKERQAIGMINYNQLPNEPLGFHWRFKPLCDLLATARSVGLQGLQDAIPQFMPAR